MRQLKPNVYAVGAIDWDRRLFDELIPLPDGTSYNAYLVKGSERMKFSPNTRNSELLNTLFARKRVKITLLRG